MAMFEVNQHIHPIRSAIVSSLLLLATACSWLPFASRSIPDCPGEIRSTEEIPGDFSLREQVTIWEGASEFPFELIAQKKGRELVLIGLSPIGAKLFTLVQIGDDTEVDALPAAALPISPLNVLRDMHRLQRLDSRTSNESLDADIHQRTGCGYSIRFERMSEEPLS
jgi:hypothetical protein